MKTFRHFYLIAIIGLMSCSRSEPTNIIHSFEPTELVNIYTNSGNIQPTVTYNTDPIIEGHTTRTWTYSYGSASNDIVIAMVSLEKALEETILALGGKLSDNRNGYHGDGVVTTSHVDFEYYKKNRIGTVGITIRDHLSKIDLEVRITESSD